MSDESEAVLLTNQAIILALIQLLKSKHIISDDDEREIYECALLSLEEEQSRLQALNENLPSMNMAREIIGNMFK